MYLDPTTINSLANARPGESLELRQVLFDRTRQQCTDSGIDVGTRARCRERTPDAIRLDLLNGGSTEIEHHVATFIAVDILHDGDGPISHRSSSVPDPRSRE